MKPTTLKAFQANATIAAALLAAYLAGEFLFVRVIGGDSGGMLYVGEHFAVMPIISLVVLFFCFKRAGTPSKPAGEVALIALPAIIPAGIILLTFTGSPLILRVFGAFRP